MLKRSFVTSKAGSFLCSFRTNEKKTESICMIYSYINKQYLISNQRVFLQILISSSEMDIPWLVWKLAWPQLRAQKNSALKLEMHKISFQTSSNAKRKPEHLTNMRFQSLLDSNLFAWSSSSDYLASLPPDSRAYRWKIVEKCSTWTQVECLWWLMVCTVFISLTNV